MIHAVVERLSSMMIPLHPILPLFGSCINRKRGIKHCEERPAFITFRHIALYGRNIEEIGDI